MGISLGGVIRPDKRFGSICQLLMNPLNGAKDSNDTELHNIVEHDEGLLQKAKDIDLYLNHTYMIDKRFSPRFMFFNPCYPGVILAQEFNYIGRASPRLDMHTLRDESINPLLESSLIKDEDFAYAIAPISYENDSLPEISAFLNGFVETRQTNGFFSNRVVDPNDEYHIQRVSSQTYKFVHSLIMTLQRMDKLAPYGCTDLLGYNMPADGTVFRMTRTDLASGHNRGF